MSGATMQAGSASAYVELEASYTVNSLSLSSPVTASIRFQSNGDIRNHNNVSIGQWYYPDIAGTPGTAYEIRATPAPDTPDGGTMNTWLALSSSRTWSETNSSGTPSDETKVFTIEIRAAGSGTVIDSATVTLSAEIVI